MEIKTTLTWYDAKKVVPIKSARCLCWMETYVSELDWSKELQGWNVYLDKDGNRKAEQFPTWWCYAPTSKDFKVTNKEDR